MGNVEDAEARPSGRALKYLTLFERPCISRIQKFQVVSTQLKTLGVQPDCLPSDKEAQRKDAGVPHSKAPAYFPRQDALCLGRLGWGSARGFFFFAACTDFWRVIDNKVVTLVHSRHF